MNADQIKANKPKNHRIQWLCYTCLQGSSDCISVSNVEKNKNPSRRKETEKKKDEIEKLCRNQFDSPLMVPWCGKMIGLKQTLYHFFYNKTSDLYIKI